jgi:hypothetical protein
MRQIFASTFIVLLLWLTGCVPTNARNIDKSGKIPIDAKRWYQLNNTNQGLSALFNGNERDRVNIGHGTVLRNYDAYYPLLEGEQMTIDSIKFFDWEGTNEKHPATVYAILDDWSKVPIAVFTGEKYGEWVGPDPKQTGKYALEKPVSNIRGIVINSWGDLPGEIEFYGPYLPPKTLPKAEIKHFPLKNFFGVNAFEWDFEAPEHPMQLDPQRIDVMKRFTGIRHYMDWEKLEGVPGSYAFAPTYDGSWNYDAMYQWCKEQNIEVLACLKTIPPWMQHTYPENERDNENIPIRYGKDPADPASYLEQAKVAFQYAARYGSNANVDQSLLTLQKGSGIRTGLGLIKYIECDNERDKWWKGRKAYQTGREYAANLSAFYDGHKNKMGPGVGVKNADPSMKVVMAGLATPTKDYIMGMIDWCKEHRGYKPDGTVDLPWDIINYHFYANDASTNPEKEQTAGIAPEAAKADSFASEFINATRLFAGDMPVWVTETGYDINPGSQQKAPAINGKKAEEVQADWILRTSLLYARAGVQKLFFYQLYDDNPGNSTKYATCGLVNKDRTNRQAADFLCQTNRLFGDYTYKETISKNPIVDRYTFNGSDMYMLVMPTQNGKTKTYELNLGSAAAAIYKPKAGSPDMGMVRQKTNGGKIQVPVSETPVFVTAIKNG